VLESAHLKASTFGRGAALRKQMLALAGLTTDCRTPNRDRACDRTSTPTSPHQHHHNVWQACNRLNNVWEVRLDLTIVFKFSCMLSCASKMVKSVFLTRSASGFPARLPTRDNAIDLPIFHFWSFWFLFNYLRLVCKRLYRSSLKVRAFRSISCLSSILSHLITSSRSTIPSKKCPCLLMYFTLILYPSSQCSAW
jgi:hypothetical protein